MKPDAIRARLAVLREAGVRLRARPKAARLAALGRVLEGWRDPGSAWRHELESRLPQVTGFAPATLRAGLELALAPWDADALRRLYEDELGARGCAPAGFDTTSLVLAGSIPMPSLLAVVAPLALGSPVLVKPASRDPLTPELVARSVAEVDTELGACVGLAPVRGSDAAAMAALCEAECVVAYGDDATIAALAARIAPPQRFVAHGHRVSLAALGPQALAGAPLLAACAGLAADIALWDQLGCLSPVAVYVQGDAAAARRAAEALAGALRALSARWPHGRVEASAGARFAHERDAAELRVAAGAALALHADTDAGFCVVCECDAALRPAPLHRFVRVHPLSDARALLEALTPLRRHLAGVALAGFGAEEPALARALAELGASRVCEPGALQAPPLSWESEGRGVLASLAR